MAKWECMVCGHVYDPAQSDPARGIPPGMKTPRRLDLLRLWRDEGYAYPPSVN